MAEEKLKLYGGNIPVLNVTGQTLPEAWEKVVLAVWDQGVDIRTEYDKQDDDGNFIDPPSRDATTTIEVVNPFAEPRIHKNIPGGPEELEIYRQEVVEGVHDHWIDPKSGKWTYTYHDRLANYEFLDDIKERNPLFRREIDETGEHYFPVEAVNQLDYLIKKSANSFYSRRTQATTWNPRLDPPTSDPPCLQRIWIRIAKNEEGEPVLNMNTHWRSRDLYRAWSMNAYALTDLQKYLAEEISKEWGREVKVGRYVDISDSLHIYGECFTDSEKGKAHDTMRGDFEAEIEKMRTEPLENRVWATDHPAFEMMTQEAKAKLKADPDFQISK